MFGLVISPSLRHAELLRRDGAEILFCDQSRIADVCREITSPGLLELTLRSMAGRRRSVVAIHRSSSANIAAHTFRVGRRTDRLQQCRSRLACWLV
jgi:hypothetical protein